MDDDEEDIKKALSVIKEIEFDEKRVQYRDVDEILKILEVQKRKDKNRLLKVIFND